jgi:hypothetical protein
MENIEIIEANKNNYNEYKEIALEVAKYHQDNANWYFSDNIEDII